MSDFTSVQTISGLNFPNEDALVSPPALAFMQGRLLA
jgi:hypothetical protein